MKSPREPENYMLRKMESNSLFVQVNARRTCLNSSENPGKSSGQSKAGEQEVHKNE